MATPATTTSDIGFATALVRLSHLVQAVFGEVSREHGCTPQQAQLLCMLVPGPVGMTELSRALHLEKSSLTGLVDRVERRGLVTRVPDGTDRRALWITLTEDGARLANATHNGVTARLDGLATQLPAEDLAFVTSVIQQLLAGRGSG
jgi:DNA-binding MarR family transcriptional regulator